MGQMTRVFVSSTYTDLIPYRDVVQKVIRQAGAVAVGMEDFGARDERPLDESLAVVAESDVFVGIYAHRYGFVPDGSQMSITEAEYQHAINKSIPVFAYLIDDNYPWPPKYLDQGEPANLLARFKDLLRKKHIIKVFTLQSVPEGRPVSGRSASIHPVSRCDIAPRPRMPTVEAQAADDSGGEGG
jgi:hypothetical protein